jgi:hypothetical protein
VAERLDVAERLAEGRLAVDRTQRYVLACGALGYEYPDLTAHPSQIRDWYDTEDGLDLRALDSDCAQLRAAGAAATEALGMQHAQLADMAAAWTGPGADSAFRFLQRHCDAGNMVAGELRAAAQRCESLRDNLWYLLNAKVSTAIAIDDRSAVQRSAWLAAADTVTTGAGDRTAAEDTIHQQIMPYVDNDIRNDWLETMRSTLAGVATSYGMVTDRMAATPAVQFELPGDLGPGWDALPAGATTAPVAAAPVAPAAAYPSLPADPAPASNPSAPAPVPAQSPLTLPAPELGTAPGETSAMPAAAGDLGGLGGLASRIVDAMGGLLGSAGGPLGDSSTFDDPPGAKNPFGEDAFDDGRRDDDDDDDDAFDDEDDQYHDADEKRDDKADEPDQPGAADPADAAAPVNPPPADVQPPDVTPIEEQPPAQAPSGGSVPPVNGSAPEPPEGSTPCEIAADALPQAGQ